MEQHDAYLPRIFWREEGVSRVNGVSMAPYTLSPHPGHVSQWSAFLVSVRNHQSWFCRLGVVVFVAGWGGVGGGVGGARITTPCHHERG